MSCLTCNYITGHDQACSQYPIEKMDSAEARLMALIEALEERIYTLEESEKARALGNKTRGF